METMKIILVFGPPGSGKDTQSQRLSEKLDLPFISTGDLFRREAKKGTDVSKKIKTTLAHGKLVSTKLVNEVLEHRLREEDVQNGFILNGYPREKVQLEHLKKKIKELREENKVLVLALNIKVSNEEVKQRLGGRRVCPKCGATYHLKYDPPKEEEVCDVCGYGLERREDDKPEVIEERLNEFYTRIDPVLTYFKKNDMLIEINGEQSIEEVEQEIQREVSKEVPDI